MAGPTPLKPGEAPSAGLKKETSKVQVAPQTRPAPQATVKLTPGAPAAAPAPSIKTAEPEATVTEVAPDQLTGILAIAATVVALAALGIQLWTFL